MPSALSRCSMQRQGRHVQTASSRHQRGSRCSSRAACAALHAASARHRHAQRVVFGLPARCLGERSAAPSSRTRAATAAGRLIERRCSPARDAHAESTRAPSAVDGVGVLEPCADARCGTRSRLRAAGRCRIGGARGERGATQLGRVHGAQLGMAARRRQAGYDDVRVVCRQRRRFGMTAATAT
jgi:hypothetical protein